MKNRSITPLPSADFTTEMGKYNTLQPFRYWCHKVLPLVYDDSLSYYELLCKVVDYLNKTMEDVETLHGDVSNLHTAYDELQSYVNNYFSTLDVQEEINNKLDSMASDGVLSNILNSYILPFTSPSFFSGNDDEKMQKAINAGKPIFIGDNLTLTKDVIISSSKVFFGGGTIELNNCSICVIPEIRFDFDYYNISGLTLKKSNNDDKPFFIVSKAQNLLIENITMKNDNYNDKVLNNAINIIADSPVNGVTMCTFKNISIIGTYIGLNIVSSNGGYVTSCVFENIMIRGAYKYGVYIDGADTSENTFKVTIDDITEGDLDRYGIYHNAGRGNKIDITAWDDTYSGKKQTNFYPLHISVLSDFNNPPEISGYMEGVIDNITIEMLKRVIALNVFWFERNNKEQKQGRNGIINKDCGHSIIPKQFYLTQFSLYGSSNREANLFNNESRITFNAGNSFSGFGANFYGVTDYFVVALDVECEDECSLIIESPTYSNTIPAGRNIVITPPLLADGTIEFYYRCNTNKPISVYDFTINIVPSTAIALSYNKDIFSANRPADYAYSVRNETDNTLYRISVVNGELQINKIK